VYEELPNTFDFNVLKPDKKRYLNESETRDIDGEGVIVELAEFKLGITLIARVVQRCWPLRPCPATTRS